MTESNDEIRTEVLKQIASGRGVAKQGGVSYRVGGLDIHVRHTWAANGAKWPFNINEATLRNDFELWICGSPSLWYFIPTALMRELREHPKAYHDSHHEGIATVTVDEDNDECLFATGGTRLDISTFRHGRLPAFRS